MELNNDTELIGERFVGDGVTEAILVTKFQYFNIIYTKRSYFISVSNITETVSERKSISYTYKIVFTANQDKVTLDCVESPIAEECVKKNNYILVHNETIVGVLDSASFNKMKNIKNLPAEICEKFKMKIPNLCSITDGIRYSMLSSLIIILLLLI